MAWLFIGTLSTLLWFYQIQGQSTNDAVCECVPFYLCVNGTINENGEGLIDIRMQNLDCDSYLDICCNKSSIVDMPLTRSPPKKPKSGCGYRNVDGIGYRIIGDTDNESQFGEFPWMVAILNRDRSEREYQYKCGGTLIHPQVVLTAAHCISRGTSYKIRAGEWDSKTTREIYRHEEKEVTGQIVHPRFVRNGLENDIALLFLETPVETASHINVACLPPQNSIVTSDHCFVTGWGKHKFEKDGVYQNILKRIELPTMGREECQNAFRRTRLGRFFRLHRSFNCAGGQEGKDACTGDGGGPLVCPIPGQEDRYQMVGIVAWGIGCGTKGVPGAYVDVALFRDWIDQELNKRNFKSSTYQI